MSEKLKVRRQIPPPAGSAASYWLLQHQQEAWSSPLAAPAPLQREEEEYQQKLQSLVLMGVDDAVQMMVDKGMAWDVELCPTTYQETPLHSAIRENKSERACQLLHIDNLMSTPNVYGELPLHLACRMGQPDVVLAMLERGVDKNAEDCEKCTPLFHAVSGSQMECAQLLIKAGCDLDAVNSELISPLDHALLYKDNSMIKLLMRAGCSTEKAKGHIYYRDHYANSFFFALWSSNCLDSMRLFLDCGYPVSKQEMSALKETCRQLIHEKEAHKLLQDATEQPLSLLSCCRQMIRRLLMAKRHTTHSPLEVMVSGFKVPQGLKDYLLLKDRTECTFAV